LPEKNATTELPDRVGMAVPISIAARQCGLTIRAMRFYEEQKLVQPIRAGGGARYFDYIAMERLGFIASARRAGIGIRDISLILDAREREGGVAAANGLREICEAHLRDLAKRRQHLELMVSSWCQSAD
jgi:DNA-binding transcriptional MerR regulator